MKYYTHTVYKMYEVKNTEVYNGQYLIKIYVSVSSSIIFSSFLNLRVSRSTALDI